jgi:hypothetical protein
MRRAKRIELLGVVVAVAVVVAAFAGLCLFDLANRPLLDEGEWRGIVQGWVLVAAPWTAAAPLLWLRWWRRIGAGLSTLDGPARLLAAATATLPFDRRDWGQAMAAELAQVRASSPRWRFALGGARTAILPPGGNRTAVTVAGGLAMAVVAATARATGAAPATRVFALTFVGLAGGLAVLAMARSRRPGRVRAGLGVAGLGLAGVTGCVAATMYYLVNHPLVQMRPTEITATLGPLTATVFGGTLAGCAWLALAPPRWLLAFRGARWFGAGMAVLLAAGLVLASRASLAAFMVSDRRTFAGVLGYLFLVPAGVFLAGSLLAATVGRSFRAGLAACAWAFALGAPLVIAVYLIEGLSSYDQVGMAFLDGDGFRSTGPAINLPDAVGWVLMCWLLGPVPLGVIGAAAGSLGARPRRAGRRAEVAAQA